MIYSLSGRMPTLYQTRQPQVNESRGKKQENRPPAFSDEVADVIHEYSDMLFRICLVMLCKEQDAEDALQETFLRYILKAPVFTAVEHQKAWLIRVAKNVCNDIGRYRKRHNHINIDDLTHYSASVETTGILETVLSLPNKHKLIVVLHYVDGYDVKSIAELLGITISTAKKRLQRAREKLKLEYEKECESYESR